MARDGLSPFVLALGLVLGTAAAFPAAPPEETEARMRTQLAVQAALQQGRDCLQRGNYQAAVFLLEKEIARVNGNRDYLNALRDAYRGYVRELTQANRAAEAQVYMGRLRILDPGSCLDPLPTATAGPLPRAGEGAAPIGTAALASAPASTELGPPKGTRAPAFRSAAPDNPATDDPFAEANRAPPTAGVHELLDRAGQEFSRQNYLAAAKLYEQAGRIDATATAAAHEQWAYCKLYAVVDALNHDGSAPEPQLEQEVRAALRMATAPKLTAFGQDVLHRLQERRAVARVEVRHTPAQGQGWAVAETANFRVLHRQSQELAEKVAQVAETARAEMSRKWFGDVPAAWSPRCDIVVHADAQEYVRGTGAPATSPGHSTISREPNGERIVGRRIDLRCDEPHMLDSVLPHEATHVVLAGRFGPHNVPRWADEGMAVLSEPQDRIELHLRNLPVHRREQTLFPVGQLLQMTEYPGPRSVGPFYAESVSLVGFLSSQEGGPRVFARFLRDGLHDGYEVALRKHYGIEGFEDLERQWQAHAFGTSTATSNTP
jgi:hypothetical protein